MTDVVLAEVERADLQGRPVLGFTGYPDIRPLTTGVGDVDLLCGRCRFVLVAAVEPREECDFQLLIRCPSCGACNDPHSATTDARVGAHRRS